MPISSVAFIGAVRLGRPPTPSTLPPTLSAPLEPIGRALSDSVPSAVLSPTLENVRTSPVSHSSPDASIASYPPSHLALASVQTASGQSSMPTLEVRTSSAWTLIDGIDNVETLRHLESERVQEKRDLLMQQASLNLRLKNVEDMLEAIQTRAAALNGSKESSGSATDVKI